ncbi:PrgI family protein [Candidatus Microgenomates bacterium]|nr:PrgI family protein [Candidatus Microgenomates bacterium]
MQQHPVPQNIASYEFHLVGDMTLRQFFQVAGGALVGLLFYASPLPGIIKWPFILFSGLAGVALAFLPIEERPLSMWFLAFLHAIYSPTKYVWQQGKTREFFAPEGTPMGAAEVAATPQGEGAAEAYLARAAQGEEQAVIIFEQEERSFFQKMLSLFHLTKTAGQPSAQPTTPQPNARPRIIVEQEIPPQLIPQVTPTQLFYPTPPPTTGVTPAPATPVTPIFAQKRGPGRPRLNAPRFEISAAPPAAPRIPNVVVGQVLDTEGNTVEAAILEIKDSEGRPVRALRTNKVGHFLTATPLPMGTYEIITDKEGLIFEPIQFMAKNEIVPPIEIRAKGAAGSTVGSLQGIVGTQPTVETSQ